MKRDIQPNDLFTWDESYSLGIAAVDEQHQFLINLINTLWRSLLSSTDTGVIGGILDDLDFYAQTHFSEEEELMQAAGYPYLSTHRESHQVFIEQIGKSRDAFGQGTPIAMELLQFLTAWLQQHIKKDDRHFADHTARKGKGRALGRTISVFEFFRGPKKGSDTSHRGLQGLDMQHAIMVHMDWLRRLSAYVAGHGEALASDEASRIDFCILGNWINANASKQMMALREFQTLLLHHNAFHRSAGEIISRYAKGDGDAARQLLDDELRPLSTSIKLDIVNLFGAYQRKFGG